MRAADPHPRRPRAVASALALALAVLAAGCGGTSTPAARPATASHHPSTPRTITVSVAPLPRGIHLSFIQQRVDEGTPRSQVRVVNGDRKPVHVVSVGVDWAGYPLGLHRVDYDVPGQQTVDLRYFLPRANCSAAAGAASIHGVAVTSRRTIREPMAADGKRYLTRLWRTECNTRRLHRAVSVRYAEAWTEEGTGGKSVLHGDLLLTRRSGEQQVSVDEVEGSVLFDLTTPGDTVLAAGANQAAVPVDVSTGGRCDPHSRGQSTQTFLFRVWLKLGDAEPVAQLAVPTARQQARLLAFLDRACGSPSSG